MKKLFFFAIVALGMTAACQKPNVEVDNPDLDDNAPVEVVFGVNAPSITVTKTKAAVDDWGDQTVYVYGFDKSLKSLANDTDGKSPMLINGEPATVTTQTTTPDSNPSASDVSDLKFGNHADPNSSAEKKFYYEVDAVYDFVGYYTGKQETVTPNGLTLTAEVEIDGSNDVMLASANPANDIDKVNINMEESRVYSAFAARRNVHPTLNFKHMLTRFSFNIVEGKTPNATTSKDVNVTEIAIETTNKGTLTIAPISAQAFKKTDNATATLTVKGLNSAGETPDENIKPIGEDLMIFPGDETVSFYVSLQPKDAGTDPNLTGITFAPLKVDLDASEINKDGTDTFKPGTKYTVTLTIYDLEQVSVSASLTEWDPEDVVTYDPDDKYASDITVTEVKVTNDSGEKISLYHNAKTFKDGVAVFTDNKLTQIAVAGNYSVDNDGSTFTVTDEGLVSNYISGTQPGA